MTAYWARLPGARPEPSARTNSDRAAHPEEAHSGAEGRLEGLARIANCIVNCLPAVGGRSRRLTAWWEPALSVRQGRADEGTSPQSRRGRLSGSEIDR